MPRFNMHYRLLHILYLPLLASSFHLFLILQISFFLCFPSRLLLLLRLSCLYVDSVVVITVNELTCIPSSRSELRENKTLAIPFEWSD